MDDEKAAQDEVVEIMAQAIAGTVRFSWDGLSEEMREHYRARARKYLSALAAAGCEVVRWRPISEAPMEKPLVLATNGCFDIGWNNGNGTFDDGDYRDHMDGFTHFAILRGPQGETP